MSPSGLMSQFGFDDPPECSTSEDCLYLNVWRPQLSRGQALPVILYLHGGAHRLGSASHAVSRGDRLAARGVVVVTANYRLGALGYLAHPGLTQECGASGHYACLDVIAALHWIRANIAAFGGDPGCVTLFGQSAGAALVHVLMASPTAHGLFHRAIGHSGGRSASHPPGALAMLSLQEAEEAGRRMASRLDATTPGTLRELPADAFDAPRGFWGPIVDGTVLRERPEAVFARGAQCRVPLIAGYNRDEAAPYPLPQARSVSGFREFIQDTFGEHFASVHALTPVRTTSRRGARAMRFVAIPVSLIRCGGWLAPTPPHQVSRCTCSTSCARFPCRRDSVR
jgi:para-nitrobenzyl esterase